MEGVRFSPMDPVSAVGGDVLRALKVSDPCFTEFGEAYFTKIDSGHIKGWTRHNRMTLNLFVCSGAVRFVIHDDGQESGSGDEFEVYELDCAGNYGRLTIRPGLWLAFTGIPSGTVLNIADIEHDPSESDKLSIHKIAYDW